MTCLRPHVSMHALVRRPPSGPHCTRWGCAVRCWPTLAALDEPVAEAVFYARAYADADARASESVLNVRDTASGRVALFRLAPTRGRQPAVDDDRPGHAGANTSRGDNGAQ